MPNINRSGFHKRYLFVDSLLLIPLIHSNVLNHQIFKNNAFLFYLIFFWLKRLSDLFHQAGFLTPIKVQPQWATAHQRVDMIKLGVNITQQMRLKIRTLQHGLHTTNNTTVKQQAPHRQHNQPQQQQLNLR
jgi:hypothetical protein